MKIYHHEKVNQNLTVKSGSDFRNVSYIIISEEKLTEEQAALVPTEPVTNNTVQTGKEYFYSIRDGVFTAKIVKHDVTLNLKQDEFVKSEIDRFYKDLEKEQKVEICHLATTVNTAFSSVRTEENPIGNFLCDLMRLHYFSDCAILNSGNIRADRIFEPGNMKIADWDDLIPFKVPVLLVECPGSVLKQACENAVSKWPALEGRFMQTSNLHFSFDASKQPGSRVDPESV